MSSATFYLSRVTHATMSAVATRFSKLNLSDRDFQAGGPHIPLKFGRELNKQLQPCTVRDRLTRLCLQVKVVDRHGLVNSHPRAQNLQNKVTPVRPSYPPRGGSPPGLPQRGERNQDSEERDGCDMFSKSEKWLPPMPIIDCSRWRTRAEEVLQFSDWVQALRAWVSLGSDIFAWEIATCIGWEQEFHMSVLRPAQQTRSARLLAIFIQTFKDFPMGNTMLQAYVEGVGVDGAFLASRGTSDFEGLRLLAREFSLRSRAEASFFRTEFLAKTCKASAGITQVIWFAVVCRSGLSEQCIRRVLNLQEFHCIS